MDSVTASWDSGLPHFRPDGGVVCGGAKQTYMDGDKAVWFNNVDDSTLIEAARPHFETVMQKNFVGWVKSGA
jgi:hypothetical protein